MKLVVQAPGKVNLCLFLGQLRADGRHELLSVIESVSLADELTISTRDAPSSDRVECAGVPEPNLVSLALGELRARGWDGPPLHVNLNKRVPVAGGMGGGSADAAALLRAAKFLSPLPEQSLHEIAAALGADVPSQLQPGLALVTGAGEHVKPLPALAPHALVIVPQPYQLSTAEVYAEADRLGLPRDAAALEALSHQLGAARPDEHLPHDLIVNDLEPATLSLRPEVGDALDALHEAGADHELVSGSGATVFGLFWGDDAIERAGAVAQGHAGAVAAVPVDAEAGRPQEID
jgi:4-diphosphocytidyl-2-C-methyl-D-erythritol kinase